MSKNFEQKNNNDEGIKHFEEEFLKSTLNLIHCALNYDFMGEKLDNTEIFYDEYAPLQIPTQKLSGKFPETQSKWAILGNEATVNLIFENFLISERFYFY